MHPILRQTYYEILKLASLGLKPYSRLILAGDRLGWVLDWEMRALANIAHSLGIRPVNSSWRDASVHQAVFFADQFFLRNDDWLALRHRIGFTYYHGLPNTGESQFDQDYTALSKHHERISRIQVTHNQMNDVILQTGIEPAKVFLIPIGINLDFFPFGSAETKIAARHKFNIPQSAFVIGSFQKDGVGWEEGLEPKLIKGPDILTRTLKQLKKTIPELFVLLVGPARGYVKVDLERLGIPYRDLLWQPYPEVGQLFSTLDLYLVTSRQEGGPKAVLESMASGVPLVTTRVGQAMDLVRHGENAWMVDVEDVDGLAYWAKFVYEHENAGLDAVLQAGRATAEANSYTAQLPLWEKIMEGFVAWEKSNP